LQCFKVFEGEFGDCSAFAFEVAERYCRLIFECAACGAVVCRAGSVCLIE
jgi:hypothetical protein